MIVLDTNVVSHMMKPRQGDAADIWIDGQGIDDLAMTSITFEEIALGLQTMPNGKRRQRLSDAFHAIYGQIPCLPFKDVEAAQCAAFRAGRRVELADMQIAGIVAHHGAILATRNTRDFEGLDLKLTDPWNHP